VAVLNETFEVKGHIVDVGASVGVALYPDDGVTAMDLVNSADTTMYQVKASGRNAVGFA